MPYRSILIISLLFILCSCNRNKAIENDISAMLGKSIALPLDSMQSFSRPYKGKHSHHTFVSYIDSTSCSDCEVTHLTDWINIKRQIEKKDLKDVEFLFLIEPQHDNISHITDLIKRNALFLDEIYVDTTGVFIRNNPDLPENKLYHTFLLDEQDKIVLVGKPTANNQLVELALELLKKK